MPKEYCKRCNETTAHYVDAERVTVVCGSCDKVAYTIPQLKIEQMPIFTGAMIRDSPRTGIVSRTERNIGSGGLDLK